MAALNETGGRVQLHFIIVGSGHAGSACALALRYAGHRVTILEKGSSQQQVQESESYRIPPNLLRILKEWGLQEAVRLHSTKCDSVHISGFESGEYLGGYRWDEQLLQEVDGDIIFIQDTDLQRILLQAAISNGISVRYDVRITYIDTETPSVQMVTAQGTQVLRGDVIVVADASLDGGSMPDIGFSLTAAQEETGIEIRRTVVPRYVAASDLGLHRLCGSDIADMFIWMGNGCSVLTYPKGARQSDIMMQTYSCSNEVSTAEKVPPVPEPRLQRLVARSKCVIKSRKILLRHVPDKWVKGKMVIIGDLAHPLPPGSLQSCALSIEDAAILAELFSHLNQKAQINEFLLAFESIRKPRCEEMHTKEYGIIYFMSLPPGEQQEYRDQAMRARRDTGLFTIDPTQNLLDTVEEKEIRDVFAYNAREEAERWWLEWGILREIYAPDCEEDTPSDNARGGRYAVRVHVKKSTTITMQRYKDIAGNLWNGREAGC
ncbi:FAD/NAD-P-binding domain-containing protein [Moniliophthora roreri MCA 2997]|uniref:FAD/NAD-P-binding domain-containing protein n=1 Tax=Moniliophthora roreri (strain MCA 2997) TaxID=1381753 RepID=V2XCM3_MONRO|nr:FAD/NAD-P-binding domain-containing protein [Moniliophthora roreri MCA 2997]